MVEMGEKAVDDDGNGDKERIMVKKGVSSRRWWGWRCGADSGGNGVKHLMVVGMEIRSG